MAASPVRIEAPVPGRPFIGIEREQKYFDDAQARISAELARLPLFEQEAKAVQQELIA